jgi:predicted kinase
MCDAQGKMNPSNEVDHIVPHDNTPAKFFDISNLQAMCKPCHSLKTYYETNRSVYLPPYVRPIAKEVILLCGASASGKTTWSNKQKGYTVIDLDRIKCDVSGQPMYEVETKFLSQAIAIRNKLITETTGKIIIIATLANNKIRARWAKDLGAKLYIMSTTEYDCVKRINKDKKRKDKRKHVNLCKAWYKRYSPIPGEYYI